MKTVETFTDLRAARTALAGTVGLVPTMGFLHAGHMALVQRACAENDAVVVSIFVNPTQFGPNEDFTSYPRDLARDLAQLTEAGVAVVWLPSAEQLYPPEFQTWVTVDKVTEPLEGAARPGHFRGVATVVSKLFNAVQPTRAYFGQKDAQQVRVIQQMVTNLNYPIEVVVCPTAREPDGLALSSRNSYLSPVERRAATVLIRALRAAEVAYEQGERSADILRRQVRQVLAGEPLAKVEYVSAADPETLEELKHISRGVLLSMAVRIGRTRLIDNLLLTD